MVLIALDLMNWHKIAVDKFDEMIYNPVILAGCNEILESQILSCYDKTAMIKGSYDQL